MNADGRKRWFRASVVAGLLVVSAIAALVFLHGRIFVTVHNTSGQPMRDVRVVVTGSNASLGDIAPAEARTCAVVPSGDSDVAVSFVDAAGARHERRVDVYLQRGSAGTVEVRLSGERVETERVNLWWTGP